MSQDVIALKENFVVFQARSLAMFSFEERLTTVCSWFDNNFSIEELEEKIRCGECFALLTFKSNFEELVGLAVLYLPAKGNGEKPKVLIAISDKFNNGLQAKLASDFLDDLRNHLLLPEVVGDIVGQFYLSGGD
ncbi:hypothetical protein L6252_02570 [Candidatus Parcubacteria bacterium]|nr:hypothetical protein [Candidatus Parcubacteria bacterium]